MTTKDFIHTQKKNTTGKRPKIKENFVLTKIKNLDELNAHVTFSHFHEIKTAVNDFFIKLPIGQKITTFSFVQDITIINDLLLKPHKASLTPALAQKGSALVLRIERFTLKFYICLKLNIGASNRYSAIDNALEEILNNLTGLIGFSYQKVFAYE